MAKHMDTACLTYKYWFTAQMRQQPIFIQNKCSLTRGSAIRRLKLVCVILPWNLNAWQTQVRQIRTKFSDIYRTSRSIYGKYGLIEYSWPELFSLPLKRTSPLSSQWDFTLICLRSFFQASPPRCRSFSPFSFSSSFSCAYWAVSPVGVTLRDKSGRRRQTEYQMH